MLINKRRFVPPTAVDLVLEVIDNSLSVAWMPHGTFELSLALCNISVD
jgi:hypothetical protein